MDDKLYCCKFKDYSTNLETSVELLSSIDIQFSTWFDHEDKNINYHTIYCTNTNEVENAISLIKDHVSQWSELGVSYEEFESFSIKKEDWSEVWKKYFDIQHITNRVVIKPSWLEYTKKEEQVVIEIDPGMSFGTGKHATTSFCLKMLDKLSSNSQITRILDAGCGSGILSICAHQLGYSDITAFDIDNSAVKIASANFEINNISENDINLFTGDLSECKFDKEPFDLVIANILSHILVENRVNLLSMIKPNHYLVLAGILTEEFDKVSSQYCKLGVKEELRFTEAEWTSGLFKKLK